MSATNQTVRIGESDSNVLYRSVAVLLAFALVGAMVGAGLQTTGPSTAIEGVTEDAVEAIPGNTAGAAYLANEFDLTNNEVTYILGLYQVRNCLIIGYILGPVAAGLCSAGSLT